MDIRGIIKGVMCDPFRKRYNVNIECDLNENELHNLISLNDSPLDISIKKHRERRSIDANAYMWALIGKIAAELHTDKDKVYLEMLSRYGVYTHIVVKEKYVERFKQEYKLVKNLGEIKVGGQSGIQLQCYFGSSTYDTKEMSVLIDGVVNEAQDLGINTITKTELNEMKERWGV